MSRLVAIVRRLLRACAWPLLLAAFFPTGALAATCGAATSAGASGPSDYQTYCWLDFSSYSNTGATGKNGQNFSYTLADGGTLSFTLKVTGGSLSAAASPSFTNAALGNAAFLNVPGLPVLKDPSTATVTATLTNIALTPPGGGTAAYALMLGDGESTNNFESLTFTTNGGAWQQAVYMQNGSLNPAVAGLNTTTVSESGSANGPTGGYVFVTGNSPTQVSAKLVSNGSQGIVIGVRFVSFKLDAHISPVRYNAADQFTYTVATQGGTALASGTTSGTALDGTAVSVPTVSASYPVVVKEAMASGSAGTLTNYTTTLTCTNANAGSSTAMPTNQPVSSYTLSSLQYGDAVTCDFTNAPLNSIVGTVFLDANHNGALDAAEGGPGVAGWYVKLAQSSGGKCVSPALQAVAPDPATGAYSFSNIQQGSYCVILDNNNSLTDLNSKVVSGWLRTTNLDTPGALQVTVLPGTTPPPPQLFGVWHGSRIIGFVFADTGVGSGTANNGVQDGAEPGLANIPVTVTINGSVVDSMPTQSDGKFRLWVPASLSGTTATVTATPPSNWVSTGGSAGGTGGTYNRPVVTYSPGGADSGVNFGMVPPNAFTPAGAQSAPAGAVVFYTHAFTAGSGGQVTFSLASTASPANAAWSAVLYQDTNCNGTLDSGETPITGAITVAANAQVCVILKQFVPAGLASGAQDSATLTASFTYTNASPALSGALSLLDVTTVGQQAAVSLQKLVQNVTRNGAAGLAASATPGDTLQYTLTAVNNGNGAITALVISDATPAFTTYAAGACPGTLPSGLTSCAVTTQPAIGATGGVQWSFTGSLAVGAQVSVTYRVQLAP